MSCFDQEVDALEPKLLCAYLSNLADMLIMMRGWTLLILETKGQGHWQILVTRGCNACVALVISKCTCTFSIITLVDTMQIRSHLLSKGRGCGGVVKLLTCGRKGPGFEPGSRHFEFRDWVSPASTSRYDWKKSSKQPNATFSFEIFVCFIK